MGQKTKTILAIALPVQIVLVKWVGSYPLFIENYYSNGIYPYISRLLRTLFGWAPFSFGDLIYTALTLMAIRYIYRNWKTIKKQPLLFLKDILVVFSIAYFAFHILWGLNYYRQPITWRLGIAREYSLEELVDFTEYLAERANHYQNEITGDSLSPVHVPYTEKEIFTKTEDAYQLLKNEYPSFHYETPSLKSSLYSLPLTYMGYGGYLNPFTNEAQVNGLTPLFRLPAVSGHEVGHQLGYSAEDATNFISFLVTSQSDDPFFRYAAYNHALGYCLVDLYNKDETKYNQILDSLNPGVKKNYKELADFWKKYENPMEPVFKAVFNTFLKVNNQKEGIKSYNSVVGLMINHQKRLGERN
ncbi:DUF3810 domain-containing protein [Allomuricauda taeanensis]|uniref:DUF3810 domain-containing protein n=1 Tax=Flagellimonas taeanensis TaxID=1005926 RepID=UPI002E7BF664|nr:DUF3810 domain-containing protein [Allomuricauda taeanensis]MEE1962833.1 DUF3810 domain-containing protein [Allomuricauda taeanensis]